MAAPLDIHRFSSVASKVSIFMLPFADDLEVSGIHVKAPTAVVFLCGGELSPLSQQTPKSLRDAFLKIHDHSEISNPQFIQAEDITQQSYFSRHYSDLLKFETDLAQITELILLFCESGGSLAELGAFSMEREIANQLLVVIRNEYWIEDSFVRLGPLQALINSYGRSAVCVLDETDINYINDSAASVNIRVLKQRLHEPILNRLTETREPTSLLIDRVGHIIKLVVGLIQEYGALTVQELGSLLKKLQIERPEHVILQYLLCAEAVDWVVKRACGTSDCYIAKPLPKDAADLKFKPTVSEKNRLRRRTIIREYWQETDPARHRLITAINGGRDD